MAGSIPLYQRASLRATRWLSQHAASALSRLVSPRLGRALVLGQTHGRPFPVSPGYARTAIRAMGTCPGFDATMKASATGYRAGPPIGAPVTVAFGSRDHLLVRRSRQLGELPLSTRRAALPRCGHVPMADDPPAVAVLITRLSFAVRQLGELPLSTRRAALPRCGHVPMADDPPAVAVLITASAARARPAEQAAR